MEIKVEESEENISRASDYVYRGKTRVIKSVQDCACINLSV